MRDIPNQGRLGSLFYRDGVAIRGARLNDIASPALIPTRFLLYMMAKARQAPPGGEYAA